MDVPNALKSTAVNRLLTVGALLGGLVAVGFGLGFQGAIEPLIDDPLNPDIDAAVGQANPILTLVFVVLGFVVWQVGKTYALFHTLPKASGRAAARRFDHERVKSDVLEGLDDRLTKIEDDLEETRRSVHELKRAEHAAAFDPEETGPFDTGSDDSEAIAATNDDASVARASADVESGSDADTTVDPDAAIGEEFETPREADEGTVSDDGPAAPESEFTFGATESSSPSDGERTDANASDERDGSRVERSTDEPERDEHRSTSDSENDPLT